MAPIMSISWDQEVADRRTHIGGCSVVSGHDASVTSVGKYLDALTGTPLNQTLVEAAIAKELKYFEDKEVWKLVPLAEARKVSGTAPVTVRWVHTNNGDDISPNMRARLVAREMKNAGDESIFAPMPPLGTLRTVLSLAATRLPGQSARCRDPDSDERIQISLVDISRADFNARIDQSSPTGWQDRSEERRASL